MTVFIYVSVQPISYSYKPEAAGGSFQVLMEHKKAFICS